MRGQLDEMQAEQRPWIYAEFGPNANIFWNQSGGLTIPLVLSIHNTDHVPAQFVTPVTEVHTSAYFRGTTGPVVAKAQKAACDKGVADFESLKREGGTVFPGQDLRMGVNPGLDKSEWKAELPGFGPLIIIYGCILYERGTGQALGATGFAYTLGRVNAGNRLFGLMLPLDPSTVPVNELELQDFPEGTLWQAR